MFLLSATFPALFTPRTSFSLFIPDLPLCNFSNGRNQTHQLLLDSRYSHSIKLELENMTTKSLEERIAQQLSSITLADLPLPLQEAVSRAGWTSLMPVQSRTMPYILDQRDVMVQSRTGSGKTGAFILPALARIDPELPHCQVVVLAPTRELALQVATEAELLGGGRVRVLPIYGGTTYDHQRRVLREGAHIVVGTPGRILDHLMNETLQLHHLQMLTFDEADRMLSVGFYPDIKAFRRYMPTDRHVNTCMFSATYPPYVVRVAEEFLVEPNIISLSSDNVNVTNIEHIGYVVDHEDKERALINLIEAENPDSALIFCNSRMKVNYLATFLQRFGYDADKLSGDLQQKSRERVLNRVREGSLRLLVATDVAARGIDIRELSHVFQYEVPDEIESYVHRAGRTGRAGASGTAIILVDLLERLRMGKIERMYHLDLQKGTLPTDEEVADLVGRRVTVHLEAQRRAWDAWIAPYLLQYEPMAELMVNDPSGIRALAMLFDNTYQRIVSAPPSVVREPAGDALLMEIAPPALPLTVERMEKLARTMADQLSKRDILRLERIARFEPLVEQYVMSGSLFNLLPLLLVMFDAEMLLPVSSAQSQWAEETGSFVRSSQRSKIKSNPIKEKHKSPHRSGRRRS